ncbi:MAG: glycosyl transferase family 9 [Bacteroidetes bacterium 4484_249]|nr:MAG: glycosyl transferase family 9 [Bacteroidetes bacterium 4484_249]
MTSINKIIISRTDSIGDVILTLPVAGVLKKAHPQAEIVFLAKKYTREIVESSENVDLFLDWDDIQNNEKSNQITKFKDIQADVIIHVFPVKEIAYLAKEANIPIRIGTTGRLYHYFTCNKLIPVSRRRSDLHEAQLNLKLLSPIINKTDFSLNELPDYYGFKKIEPLNDSILKLISKDKFNLVLHPKSKGSAREWGLKNFARLIEILPKDNFEIFISGTKEEGELIKNDILDKYPQVTDLTGKLTLKELISFINEIDGLVAASTGPLHIAAALGKHALGIYPPIKPMHPGRWAPLGKNADYFVIDKNCNKCRKLDKCECIESIKPEDVKSKLVNFLHKNTY